MLSAEQIQKYKTDGFLVVENYFNPTQLMERTKVLLANASNISHPKATRSLTLGRVYNWS
jgi:hypothetical protein